MIFLECYWKSVSKFQKVFKGQNYDCNKFSNNKAIIMLNLKKNIPQFNFRVFFCGLYSFYAVGLSIQ